jgi:hypothetical protein
VYTEPLPSNDRQDTRTDTQTDGKDLKYATEMDSSAITYTPSFINIGSGIQKLIGGKHRHRDIQIEWRSHKPTFIFSK